MDCDVPPDPTLEFGPEWADVIVPNREGLGQFWARLRRLVRSWGVLRGEAGERPVGNHSLRVTYASVPVKRGTFDTP